MNRATVLFLYQSNLSNGIIIIERQITIILQAKKEAVS